jgi:adiponectin receptor
MPSFQVCLKSIFIHTETGNIWTHLLGFVPFIFFEGFDYAQTKYVISWTVYKRGWFGGCSFWVQCLASISGSSTQPVVILRKSLRLPNLDHLGITLLMMGSFVSWLYFSFYCSPQALLIYSYIVCVLGISAIVVAQWV